MQRYLLLLPAFFLAVLLLPGQVERGAMPRAEAAAAEAAGAELQLTENPDNGYVTVETPTIKGVWHTRVLPTEDNNRGGGSLYGLYHKPSDPQMTRNLVAYPSFRGWGNGQSTALWAGIGGIGATTLYASDTPPAFSQSYNFADVIGDNNLSSTLESYSVEVDSEGNAVLTFGYRVHNQQTGKTWYRVTKRWKVAPEGTIRLEIDWEILSSGYMTEPVLRSNLSWNVGWNRFVKYGRNWGSSTQQKYFLGNGSMEEQNCWDTLNRFVPDWIAYTGSPTAPTIIMRPDYSGGFPESGSYKLGISEWGSPANPAQEQCALPNRYVSAHVINWMAAWGGSPPKGNRYRHLEAGTAWSDLYRIDLTDGLPAGSMDTAAVSVNPIGNNSVLVTWETNTDTDSVVEASTNINNAGSWYNARTESSMTRNHSLTVNNLTPGTNYTFRVKSRDAAGNLAVSSGYRYRAPGLPFVLSISEHEIYWRNYSDFQNRKLTVDFNIYNQGPHSADNIKIDSIHNSNGVTNGNPVPLVLGHVNAGANASFSNVFVVPTGVQSFRTELVGSGIGPNGEVINFPQS